jgi:hypothetical protein
MAGEQPPESWIGQPVHLSYWRGKETGGTECVLQRLSDQGVVVDHKGEIRFYPWHAVLEITLMSTRRARRLRVG